MNLCSPCPLGVDLIKEPQCSNQRNLLPVWPPPTLSPLGNYIFDLAACGGGAGKKRSANCMGVAPTLYCEQEVHLVTISSLKEWRSVSE